MLMLLLYSAPSLRAMSTSWVIVSARALIDNNAIANIQSNLIITEIIKRFKKLEKTVIISSHIFSTLAETCDEIYLMKNGEIVKKVEQAGFNKLENEMKEFTVGNRIDKLELK